MSINSTHPLVLTTDNISVVKKMASKRKIQPIYSTNNKEKKIKLFYPQENDSDDEHTYWVGNSSPLHEKYHTYIESFRVRGDPIPTSSPETTQLAIKYNYISKNKKYKPKCDDNCYIRKQIFNYEMDKYFHSCVKHELNGLKCSDSDLLDKPFYVDSLDKLCEDDHYLPSCCSRDKTLKDLSKCYKIKIKY